MSFYNPLARIFSLLESIRAAQAKERISMSALTDAVDALTATSKADHEELVLVLNAVRDFPLKMQAAIDAALESGVPAWTRNSPRCSRLAASFPFSGSRPLAVPRGDLLPSC